MALLTSALAYVAELITDAAIGRVTTDPRDIAPPCIVIEPPTMVSRNLAVATLTFQISALAAPPMSGDAINQTLATADGIAALAELQISAGRPGIYTAGQQELPCYTLTATITYEQD